MIDLNVRSVIKNSGAGCITIFENNSAFDMVGNSFMSVSCVATSAICSRFFSCRRGYTRRKYA